MFIALLLLFGNGFLCGPRLRDKRIRHLQDGAKPNSAPTAGECLLGVQIYGSCEEKGFLAEAELLSACAFWGVRGGGGGGGGFVIITDSRAKAWQCDS
jgi:hypothetical protein